MQQEPIRGKRRHQIEQTLAINTEPYLPGLFEPRRMHQVASGLYRWLSRLSVPELYGLCAVFLFASWLCLSLGRHAWLRARKWRHLAFWRSTNSSLLRAWRHYLHVHLPKVFRWLDISTYQQGLVVAIFSAANIVVLSYGADSWATTQRRAGTLAVIHVIPLCTGINFGFPADTLLTDHLVLAWLHRWVGRTFLLHSLLHGSLVASSARTSAVTAPPSILPIVVSVVACSSQNALTPSRLYALSSSPCWALGRRSGGVTRRLL